MTAPVGGKSQHWSKFGPDKELVKRFLKDIETTTPKFVVADELMEITTSEKYQNSLLDMQRLGILRLPFPAMTTEFETKGGRAIVVIRDNLFPGDLPWEAAGSAGDEARQQPFYGIPYRIEKDQYGEYLIASPGVYYMGVEEQAGKPWLRFGVSGSNFFKATPQLNELVRATHIKEASLLWRALASSSLLLNTEGVAREIIECEKINRKRAAAKKSVIPRHTYLHIGRVYKSATGAASEEYVPRKSPIPHWRRGHSQIVHHGKGKTQIKTVFINPRIIAAGVTDEDPSMAKEYHVSK